MSENTQFMRTDKAIIQALINLLKTKPFEKITVQDILEETPVTRATFYAHFHDKYEIAEKMLDHFFQLKETIKQSAHTGSASTFNESMQKIFHDNRDLTEALLKVHTGKVNFRQAIAEELEKDYLRTATTPNKDVEARIFAQAYTELHLAYIDSSHRDLSLESISEVCINVTLRLLGLDNDEDARAFIYRKIAQNTVIRIPSVHAPY